MAQDIIIIPNDAGPNADGDALIQDREILFLNMREMAFAQLNANYALGLDATLDQKDEFVKNFLNEEIDTEELNDLMPAKVFEQYFEMLKEKEEFEGCPVIKELSLMEAVNKMIYYGLIKTYSQLHDKGLVDMYCSPDGNISFAPKGQIPKFPEIVKKDIVAEPQPSKEKTIRVKIVKPKKTKPSKTIKKKPVSKKPTKKSPKNKKPKRKGGDNK